MKAAFPLLLLLAAASARAEVQDAAGHPVTKVIGLLKDMIKQLETEAEEDKETYEQMGCWCETNDKEKTKAIQDAEARIKQLSTSIEELTQASSRLTAEIKVHGEEIDKAEQALETAKTLRTKQLAEFNAEEKDMIGSIGSLKGAVVALGKHNDASLLQLGHQAAGPLAVARAELRKHHALLAEVVTPHQRHLIERLASFVQEGSQEPRGVALNQQAPSNEIFGVLSQMKETFETNLKSSQTEETSNQKAYEDLKSAQESELGAAMTASKTKTAELAKVDETNAQSKEDLDDTQDSMDADTAFLADVKSKCAALDKEYEERTTTRQQEIEASTKALGFLSSDEAHELFSRTLGAASSFLQRSSRASSAVRTKAIAVIRKVSTHDPRFVALQTQMRLDSFEKVKKTLTDMVNTLTEEKGEDIKKKDACIDGFNKNDAATQSTERTKEKEISKVEELTMTVDELTKAIDVLNAEIAEGKKQMKRAGEDREIANKEFQETVADQRATEKLLTAALNVLKGFYDKAALIQAGQPAFKDYKKNENSGGVMGMISAIINEGKQLEAEALQGEEDAQTAYELFVKDTNEANTMKEKDVINKSDARAKATEEKVQHEEQRDEALTTLEQLANELHDLHIDCDFTIKNFDIRTEARDEEIEALKSAIAMFSGATFSAFLQAR